MPERYSLRGVFLYHCRMTEDQPKCGCGQPRGRMFRCLSCHNLARRVKSWRNNRCKKVNGYWRLPASTAELRKAGVLSVPEIEEAVAEAARMNGWL